MQPMDIARLALDAASEIGVQTFLKAKDLLMENQSTLLGFLVQIFNARKNLQYPSTWLIRKEEILVLAKDSTESIDDLMGTGIQQHIHTI
jgi:hypothetical protein